MRGVKDAVWFCRKPDGTREDTPMDKEEKAWEILLSADKKDYESICIEYGITNFRGMLTRLIEMKKEKEAQVAQVGLCSFTRPRTGARRKGGNRYRCVCTLQRMHS